MCIGASNKLVRQTLAKRVADETPLPIAGRVAEKNPVVRQVPPSASPLAIRRLRGS